MTLKVKLAVIIICNIKSTSSKMTGHLIDGSAAKITDFPHSAFLVISCFSDRGEGHFLCGASIVNQVILLTAAHCFIECKEIVDAFVTYGHEQIDKGIAAKVLCFITHEDHGEGILSNDIALVLLETELELSNKVSRVGLLKRKSPYEGYPSVAGWGKVNTQSSDASDILMYTRQQILPRLTCQFTLNNPEGTFCAENRPGMGYPSSADSGSALVVSEFIQVGLVSYMDPIVSNRITVYTNVSYFYDWIQNNSNRLYCKGDINSTLKLTYHPPSVFPG